MRNVNVLGLVFPNQHDACLGGLTTHRSLGSVPFGARYRLIDFVLSNMVNAGISKVGLATKSNYQSLMDHLGTGKPWDLDRKNGGLYFHPMHMSDAAYSGRVAPLYEMRLFLRRSQEDYVLMADCDTVGNFDYAALIDRHIESGADVTVGYRVGKPPRREDNLLLTVDGDRLCDLCISADEAESAAWGIGLYVIRRDLLLRLVEEAYSRNQGNFERDILQQRQNELKLCGYELTEYAATVSSLASYVEANMALLDPAVRRQVFLPDRRIYTKVRDCAPAQYGLHSSVSDSLVGDGAVIEGAVTRSIIFRDAVVGPGVTLSDCIIMQGSEIRADAKLGYVICDKNVQVCDAASLQGVAHYPVYVKKDMKI